MSYIRNRFFKFFSRFLFCAVFIHIIFTSACITRSSIPGVNNKEEHSRILLRTTPAKKPVWKDIIPQDNEYIYFVGISRAYSTETDARNAAREDARIQILKYYGQYIKNTSKETAFLQSDSDDILNPYIERVDEFTSFAESVLREIRADHYYTEIYRNEFNKEEFIVSVLCQINKKRAELEINSFAERTSNKYHVLIDTPKTVMLALETYHTIFKALQDNPLERVVSFYESKQGRTSLYLYCYMMIQELAGNIRFKPVFPYSIASNHVTAEKGQSLRTKIFIDSENNVKQIGAARCKIQVYGDGKIEIPEAYYNIGNDNAFDLIIYTDKLQTGKHNVHLELVLNKAIPELRHNPEYGFSLEIIPPPDREKNPFLLPRNEYWIGKIEYVSIDGKKHQDTYALVFFYG
jgi:hypothetical protein